MAQQQYPQKLDKSGYLAEDTIAALITGVGGAISVIRVSGPSALSVLDGLCKKSVSQSTEAKQLTLVKLYDLNGVQIDDGMFVLFRAPHSYTGENVVELHLHASAFVRDKVLETAAFFGARQALPGEFSFRAVRNGKMSLTQAQAVSDLIAATNQSAVSLALEKLSGLQNKQLKEISDGLKKVLTMSELGIDFSDQDVDELSLSNQKNKLQQWVDVLRKLRDGFKRGQMIQEGVRVAIVGLPNAGKSSFFNALLGSDRAIVSDVPGTTRDVLHEQLVFSGKKRSVTFSLLDTAGLRKTVDQVEKQGIDRAMKEAKSADIVLLLVDVAGDVDEAVRGWRELSFLNNNVIGVLTKADLLDQPAREQVLKKIKLCFDIKNWVFVSTVSEEGLSSALDLMEEQAQPLTQRNPAEILLTKKDHYAAVLLAIQALERALGTKTEELFAADVRYALAALSPLIGETLPDDILGKIFSEFCIGK